MDLKKWLALGLIAMAFLVAIEPVDALLWPTVIGTCGLGGLFGPFGLNGPFGPFGMFGFPGFCGAVPFGVPFAGCGLGAWGAGFGFPC